MLTDYKFWYIKRDDAGFIIETAIRFFEGDIALIDGINRYKRTKRLALSETPHTARPKIVESNGKECALYFPADFGSIKTEQELSVFLNSELKKDTSRTPVDQQK